MNKRILRLAIPNILSNLSIPLISSVDTALMGRMDSTAYIGALSMSSLIFSFIYFSFSFLRMGTTGLTAQAFGKQDQTAVTNTLFRALLIALAGGLVIMGLQIPLAELSFGFLDISTEVETYARAYYDIRIWAAPATLLLYAITGWFFGIQNTVVPMVLTVFTNVANAVLSTYFVSNLGLKTEGVALGTVIAQYTGLFVAISILGLKYRHYFSHFQVQLIFQLKAFKDFMVLNGNIFLRTFSLMVAFTFFNNQSAIQGDLVLAANSVLIQFIIWMAFGIDGFAYTSESLVGKYLGANDRDNLKKAIRYSFYWAMGNSICYSLVYFSVGEHLLWIFTDQQNVINQAKPFLFWMILFPIVATPCYIWDGIYIGYTASKQMRNTMFIALASYILFFYGQASFLSLGNHGLWLSLIFFVGIRGVVQWFVFKKIARNH